MPKVSKVRRSRSGNVGISKKAVESISPLINESNIEQQKEQDNKNVKDSTNPSSTDNTQKDGLSRGQRKRNAKKLQYLKRENMILSTLAVKRKENQKNRIDGLDALKEALSGVASNSESKKKDDSKRKVEDEKAEVLVTNKAKKDLAAKEIHHMNLVLQHPSFKENPFAAIQEHLKNTLSSQAEQQKIEHVKQTKLDKKKEELKKKKRKENKERAKAAKSVNKKRRKAFVPMTSGRRRR